MGLQTEGEKLSAGQKALFSPGGSAPEAFSSSEMNLFRYGGDDPVDNDDPSGLNFTDDMPAKPTDRIDKNHVGQTFAATDVKIVEHADGTYTLRLDVTITNRLVADNIFWHGKWTPRTNSQKNATREHEEIEHKKDWQGFHDARQKEVPNTRFTDPNAAEAAQKPLQDKFRSEARTANKEFENHKPDSRWEKILKRERP